MNGAHDMGGVDGFGPVIREDDEPIFHAEWERRAFALNLAAAANGKWNIDMSRSARENTPPADYLSRSYYEMWLYGLEKLVVERGLVSQAELDAAQAGDRFEAVTEAPLTADAVGPALAKGSTARRDADVPPLFAVGQTVRVTTNSPLTHTRAPRYVRGHVGVIERDHGVYVFADTNATVGDPKPQHLYAVRFEAADLWGDERGTGAVFVDLWDDHLSAVADTPRGAASSESA